MMDIFTPQTRREAFYPRGPMTNSPRWPKIVCSLSSVCQPKRITIPKTQQPRKEEFLCFILEGGCRIPLKMGNGCEGRAFVFPGHPRGLPGVGLRVTTWEAAFCSPDQLQRQFHNTFSPCCSGWLRRSLILSPGFSGHLSRRGWTCHLLGNFSHLFWQHWSLLDENCFSRFCPCPALIVVVEVLEPWRLLSLIWYFFPSIFSHFVSLLVKGDWLNLKGR